MDICIHGNLCFPLRVKYRRVCSQVAPSSTSRCLNFPLLNLDLISSCFFHETIIRPDQPLQADSTMASTNPSRGIGSTSKRVADEPPQSQQRAKKPKTISVAGLFAKKRAEPDQIASTDGITHKQLTAEEILTAKAKRHPAYLDVKRMWRVKIGCMLLTDRHNRGHCSLRPWRGRINRRAARCRVRRPHGAY